MLYQKFQIMCIEYCTFPSIKKYYSKKYFIPHLSKLFPMPAFIKRRISLTDESKFCEVVTCTWREICYHFLLIKLEIMKILAISAWFINCLNYSSEVIIMWDKYICFPCPLCGKVEMKNMFVTELTHHENCEWREHSTWVFIKNKKVIATFDVCSWWPECVRFQMLGFSNKTPFKM